MVETREARRPGTETKTCTSFDGVTIAYSAAGRGETALVFVHGGMADRSFYDAQLRALSGRYRVVALDLAGHGESGADRERWGIAEFGADVRAVVEAETISRAILFGNSLGGPVVIEAALRMPDRILGVVGIDTFQDLGHPETPEYRREAEEWTRQRVAAFAGDYAAAMRAIVDMLFHPDADPALKAALERRMVRTPQRVTLAIVESIGGYEPNDAARRLRAPLRAINGDLYPTDVEAIRRIRPDFAAIVMKHVGHYPMLERPEEFNEHVVAVVEALRAG